METKGVPFAGTWLGSNDTILLNEIPVVYSVNPKNAVTDASQLSYAGPASH